MTISRQQAEQTVHAALSGQWTHGTLKVQAIGEDVTHFLVEAGAREWMDGGDLAYATVGGGLALCAKDTGAVRFDSFGAGPIPDRFVMYED